MTEDLFTLYWVLVAGGFVLIAAEIFIPGGVLGVIGALALLAAGAVGFMVFDARGGLASAFGLLIGGVIFLYLWIKYCPRSQLGRWFTLQEDGRDYKSFDEVAVKSLIARSGTAHTDLRPAGIALIDGEQVDVVTEAGFIPRGTPIHVIEAAGARVVVRAVEPPPT
jgi:membrane-bound serine protease (ClpP class)